MKRPPPPAVHGVLVVDKPAGVTSHDVVAKVRKALGTRAVGHAGTLDPMATGVLVVAVGAATKLVPYLTADEKEYLASVTLGVETDSLDADGQVVAERAVPPLDRADVERVLAPLRGTTLQTPPRVSAIKVDGVRMHARVRRGETIDPAAREVTLHDAVVASVEGPRVDLRLRVSKGFYVRALARDLASGLGTVGHLSRLRRTRSGSFTVEGAFDGSRLFEPPSDATRESLFASVRPIDAGCASLPRVVLDEAQVGHARHGRPIPFELEDDQAIADGDEIAVFGPSGTLVAIAAREGAVLRVRRGFPELADEG